MEPGLTQAPSHYWLQQGFGTLQADAAGLATREIFGTRNLLWGLGPGTVDSAVGDAAGSELGALPADDAAAIASGNCARLFRIKT
jgi:hypothetical protein